MTASTADYYGILELTSDATRRWTVHTTGTLTKFLLIQTTPVTHLRGIGFVRHRLWPCGPMQPVP
jgi:hypothetical protein